MRTSRRQKNRRERRKKSLMPELGTASNRVSRIRRRIRRFRRPSRKAGWTNCARSSRRSVTERRSVDPKRIASPGAPPIDNAIPHGTQGYIEEMGRIPSEQRKYE